MEDKKINIEPTIDVETKVNDADRVHVEIKEVVLKLIDIKIFSR